MRIFPNLAKLLVMLLMTYLMVACADRAGDHAELDVAAQEANASSWQIVQATDFNFDGMADVIWNDPGQNLIAVWLMNGDRLLSMGPLIPGPSGSGWEAVTAADFNADGMADVLWNNPAQNLASVWLMNGDRLLAAGPPIQGPIGADWVLDSSVGDFNFDGLMDLVWNDPKQNLMSVWLMNGTRLLSMGPLIPGPSGEGWTASTIADFNFDGMEDLVWKNSKQNLIAIWLMNGVELLAPGPSIPGPSGDGWRLGTSGDFNADGMADLIWTNSLESLTSVSLMNGNRLLAQGPIIPGPSLTGWTVVAASDFNSDDMADAIWQASGGKGMAVWLMAGSRLLAPGPVIPGPL